MFSSPQSAHGLRFGIFEMDLVAHELRKDGLKVKLQEQPFKILATLAGRSGQIVSREELYALLSSHTAYDSKHGLNNAIQKIRGVLGDSPDNPRFIETVPNRGYRFLPRVDLVYKPSPPANNQVPATEHLSIAAGNPPPGHTTFPPTPEPVTNADGKRRRWLLWLVAAAITVIATVALVVVLYRVRIQLTLSDDRQGRQGSIEYQIRGPSSPAYTVRVNPKAYLAYLEGLQALNRRTKEGFEAAIADFDRAITIDPNYALPYVELARTYNLAPIFGVSTPAESYPQAAAAAVHALSLDDTLAEAHTALGFAKTHWEFDWPGAEREFRKGIELDPNSVDAHFFYSNCYLSPLGRHAEAIEEMKKALELDPLSVPVQSYLGRTYLFAHRYDEARKQLSIAASMDPTFAITHERLAHVYEYLGNYEEAISEEKKAGLLANENPETVITREHALREAFESAGSRGYWKKLLELPAQNQPEAYATSYGVAVIYAELGETEKALKSLDKAYVERDGQMQNVGSEPAFDRLRSGPQFQSLLRRMGLVK